MKKFGEYYRIVGLIAKSARTGPSGVTGEILSGRCLESGVSGDFKLRFLPIRYRGRY